MPFDVTARRKLPAQKISCSTTTFKSRSLVIASRRPASSCDNENIPSPRRRAKIQREERSRWFPCLYLTPRRNPVRLASSVGNIVKETKLDICSHRHTFALCLPLPRRDSCSRWYRDTLHRAKVIRYSCRTALKREALMWHAFPNCAKWDCGASISAS